MIIETLTEFEVTNKVGMLGVGVYIIHSHVDRGAKSYYRVTNYECANFRIIGIIDQSIFDQSILDGDIIIGKKAKIKIKKEKGVDKLGKV